MRRRVLTLTVAGLILLGTGSGTAMVPHFEITIDGWSPYFSPARATIRPGAAVHWVNPTASPHTITHDQQFVEKPFFGLWQPVDTAALDFE